MALFDDLPEFDVDETGRNPDNYVEDEEHTLALHTQMGIKVIIPWAAPFFEHELKVFHKSVDGTVRLMSRTTEYRLCFNYETSQKVVGEPVWGGIAFIDDTLDGTILVSYQTLGGDNYLSHREVYNRVAQYVYNPLMYSWSEVTDKPEAYNPMEHFHDVQEIMYYDDLVKAILKLADAIAGSGSGSSCTCPPLWDNTKSIQETLDEFRALNSSAKITSNRLLDLFCLDKLDPYLIDLIKQIIRDADPDDLGIYNKDDMDDLLHEREVALKLWITANFLGRTERAIDSERLEGETKAEIIASIP